jgi:hypothetical protein
VKHFFQAMSGKEFVCGLASTLPVSVVIDDENAADA